MYSDIFTQGTLDMSTTPAASLVQTAAWGDIVTNKIMVVLSVALVLLILRDLFILFGPLVACADRPKGCAALEHSVGMARSRNLATAVFAVPYCLVLDRFEIFRPAFWDMIPQLWSAPAAIGMLAAAAIVRWLFYIIFRPHTMHIEARDTVHHCLFNFFILTAMLTLVTAGILGIIGISDASIRITIMVETVVIYLLSLIRTGQILAAHCSGFSTFLYLCTLEILPVAILVLCILFS